MGLDVPIRLAGPPTKVDQRMRMPPGIQLVIRTTMTMGRHTPGAINNLTLALLRIITMATARAA